MTVIVEGIDGSGKTTLAKHISRDLSIPFMDRDLLGRGVPKSFEEVVERLKKYLATDGVVFDRHTAVSQPIYGIIRNDPILPLELIRGFYSQNNIIIYARCLTAFSAHKPSPGDTEEHLKSVATNWQSLLTRYDVWAASNAHIFYRRYEDEKLIIRMVQGAFKR